MKENDTKDMSDAYPAQAKQKEKTTDVCAACGCSRISSFSDIFGFIFGFTSSTQRIDVQKKEEWPQNGHQHWQ